jgi:phenylpropionate dioxygenase-like ring-hydroxylating dioxygenase large terminal subunit
MSKSTPPLLWNFWYLVLPSAQLKKGRMRPKTVMGEPLVLGRTVDGMPFALRDICPHRAMPLRHGHFDGSQITCCYHGWKFDAGGRCTQIPSLLPEQDFDIARVRVKNYPCRDVQGNVWVYFARKPSGRSEDPTEPPLLPDIGDSSPQAAVSMIFPCHTDHAAFGLMDPTHAAFVHISWWWKKQARKLRVKQKEFEPAPLGWRMKRHRLPPENRAYKLLGREVTTEITYRLPGIRIEHIKGDKHAAVGLTAITPISQTETEVHQCFYSTVPFVRFARPLAERFARIFLGQDRNVVVKQLEGLAHDPALMLIDDADTQAKWYHRLKNEWLRAQEEERPFVNPIEPKTLRWRS